MLDIQVWLMFVKYIWATQDVCRNLRKLSDTVIALRLLNNSLSFHTDLLVKDSGTVIVRRCINASYLLLRQYLQNLSDPQLYVTDVLSAFSLKDTVSKIDRSMNLAVHFSNI